MTALQLLVETREFDILVRLVELLMEPITLAHTCSILRAAVRRTGVTLSILIGLRHQSRGVELALSLFSCPVTIYSIAGPTPAVSVVMGGWMTTVTMHRFLTLRKMCVEREKCDFMRPNGQNKAGWKRLQRYFGSVFPPNGQVITYDQWRKAHALAFSPGKKRQALMYKLLDPAHHDLLVQAREGDRRAALADLWVLAQCVGDRESATLFQLEYETRNEKKRGVKRRK